MKCKHCGLKIKENTEGMKGFCQGHSVTEMVKAKTGGKIKEVLPFPLPSEYPDEI